MFDRLLEIGSTFDWISPLFAFLKDVASGPSHTFLIPNDCGWIGVEIERLLRRQGIKTWGLMMVGDTILITVPQSEAGRAQQVLEQSAIPIQTPVTQKAQSKGRTQSAPSGHHRKRTSRHRAGLLDLIDKGIDDLLGL